MKISHDAAPNIAFLAMLLLFCIGATATRRDFSNRNVVYAPAMYDTPASQPQSESRLVPGGSNDRPAPEGTIARGHFPFSYPDTVTGREQAGWKLENPVDPTPATLARGRVVYENFCGHCHGALGYGDGAVAERSPLGMPLVGKQTRNRRDGELFHIITYGRLLMPAHGAKISQTDRWKVIHFVRALQAVATKTEEKPEMATGW